MPATIFLFILEPNLSILCVSIPMLRPFYSKYKKRARGSTRLQEFSEPIGSSGYKEPKSKLGQKNNAKDLRSAGIETQLEMESYSYRYDGTKHDAEITTYDNESGSEKNLATSAQAPGKDSIGVETKWTVTRSWRDWVLYDCTVDSVATITKYLPFLRRQ